MLLAIPMVLEMAMESVFAVADVFFVAKLGADAVATVGLTESVLTLVYAVAIGLSMATTATIARRVGEGDKDGAARAGFQAILIGVVLSVVVGLPAFLFAADVLRLMGAEQGVIDIGSGYAAVLLGTNLVIMLLFLNNAIFRGAGDAVVAMKSLWLANGINLVLDPCLIFGLGFFPEMGVTGAAVATACGRGCGVVYQLVALHRGAGRLRILPAHMHLDPAVAWKLARVSFGGISQYLIGTASWVGMVRITAAFGSSALAGYTIAVRIVVFAILPSWGLCNAAATLVGQNLGAGKPERAERAVWLTGTFNMVFMALVTVVFVSLAEPMVGLFTEDVAVLAVAAEALRVMSYGYVLYAWGMVLVQAFNGAGDTMTPTRVNLLCFWVIELPLAWLLAHVAGLGPGGVFWAVVVAETVLCLVAAWLFRKGLWKERAV